MSGHFVNRSRLGSGDEGVKEVMRGGGRKLLALLWASTDFTVGLLWFRMEFGRGRASLC